MDKIRCILTAVAVFALLTSTSAQIVINEFSCSNLNQYPDNYGKYEDWIELYNTTASPVSLAGYYLSDDSLDNTKWEIPVGVTIPANGFVCFWTDGRDEVSGAQYHTNFKLTQTKNNNEYIVLANPSAVTIDIIEIRQETQLGHSYGRSTNGSSTWGVFTTPTKNVTNNTETCYADYASRPDFSFAAGFYPSQISVALTTTEPSSSIHYTTDGTPPTLSSATYSTPITISANTILKAVTFTTDPTILPSFIAYNTYFINTNHTLPVVSIAGYQLSTLANGDNSLYPHGTIEYFDTLGVRKAKSYGEFNSHGQDSWANSQRSLDFVARDEMGYSKGVKEKLFVNSDRDEFQRLILRAAGDDNYPADHHSENLGSAHLRDAYIHNIADEANLHVDMRRGSKCVIYLNGQYWGVYDLREIPDDHDYTEYYYGQDKYNIQYILTWGSTWAEYGGTQALTDWNNLYNFIMTQDMSDPANYQYVTDRYDEKSLVDYVLVNMFTVCSDWLNWNTGWWRGLDSTGSHLKWGYILWDNDATFGHYINYTGIPNTNYDADPCDPEVLSGSSDPEGHIQILLKLRENPEFDQYYISRQIDLWNTVFSCDNMLARLDSTAALIAPEMTAHAARWSGTYSEWNTNVQTLRSFITNRCPALSSGFMDCYSLSGPYQLTLNTDVSGAGSVRVNTTTVNQFPWTATYFGNLTTELEVLPAFGYEFDGWTAQTNTWLPLLTDPVVSCDLSASDTVIAHFTWTSLNENKQHPRMQVFPSVTSDGTTVHLMLPESNNISIQIVGLDGKQSFEIMPLTFLDAGEYQIGINFTELGLPPGLYVVYFTSQSGLGTAKVVYTK